MTSQTYSVQWLKGNVKHSEVVQTDRGYATHKQAEMAAWRNYSSAVRYFGPVVALIIED